MEGKNEKLEMVRIRNCESPYVQRVFEFVLRSHVAYMAQFPAEREKERDACLWVEKIKRSWSAGSGSVKRFMTLEHQIIGAYSLRPLTAGRSRKVAQLEFFYLDASVQDSSLAFHLLNDSISWARKEGYEGLLAVQKGAAFLLEAFKGLGFRRLGNDPEAASAGSFYLEFPLANLPIPKNKKAHHYADLF